MFTRSALVVLLLCSCSAIATAQKVSIEPRAHAAPVVLTNATFRLNVKLIQIPVTVTDQRDRPVMDLKRSAFRIFEDDVEQEVASFSTTDAPLSAGVVFDQSGSMKNHIAESRAAVDQFLETAMPDDEFFLVKFSDNAELVLPFTRFNDEVSKSLGLIEPHGWTALIDAAWRSISEMRHARNGRHVLMIFSDGADNNSRYSEAELVSLLREADVQVFAIGLFERPRLLERLADVTGGRVIWVKKTADLAESMEKLSQQIRNQYVVGYFSDHARNDGKYHKVRIEVAPPSDIGQVRVTWRRGYTEP
jgi:Ca-activated chloride channel family protein